MPPSPGRPRRASQELLQEAAFELFQLRGYRSTSVEQIAKTAGFSRATFFNFFASKAELFWLETDALIAALRDFLEQRLGDPDPPSLDEALLSYADTMNSSAIPWALQNFRLIEATDDLIASGAGRVLGLTGLFRDYLGRSAAADPAADPATDPAADSAVLNARAAVTTSLVLVALLAWIDAGVGRGGFRDHLARALSQGAPPSTGHLSW